LFTPCASPFPFTLSSSYPFPTFPEADTAQLVEAQHPSATEKAQVIENVTTRLAEVSSAAEQYSNALATDLQREQQLVGTRKDFVAASNKLDAWLATADDLVHDEAHGPGTGTYSKETNYNDPNYIP
jgi:hypothetical protein